jgi:1-acyl-sn-glycerol-3-phosphate acyltransferase
MHLAVRIPSYGFRGILIAMGNHADASTYAPAPSRGLFRTVWGALATAMAVLYTVAIAPVAALLAAMGRLDAVTAVSTLWARLIVRTCGVRLEIEGLENLAGLGQYVLVCNHQSFFDIFAIVGYMPGKMRFVAKKELLRIPFVGYAMEHGGHVIIDRQAGGKQIRQAVETLRAGFSLCVFAEGHRFNDNRVHEFSDGGAWLAILAQMPAVPMAISGSGAFFPRLAKIVIPGGKMRMTIGRPISTAGLKSHDREQVTRRLEEVVRAMFLEEVA